MEIKELFNYAGKCQWPNCELQARFRVLRLTIFHSTGTQVKVRQFLCSEHKEKFVSANEPRSSNG